VLNWVLLEIKIDFGVSAASWNIRRLKIGLKI